MTLNDTDIRIVAMSVEIVQFAYPLDMEPLVVLDLSP
jgi:hypothetical protein